MNRLARAPRLAMWTLMVLALAACAAPISPPPPSATRPVPVPPAAVQKTKTPLSINPTPTPRKIVTTPVLPIAPPATPRPHQFDDVDAPALLAALFPDLKFTPADDAFLVNGDPDWTMWVNARAEGQFMQGDAPELAVIIANEAPRISAAQAQRYAPWGAFLAILQRREGRLQIAQRSFVFPIAISPLAFDVRIDRVVDFDHDDQDELFIVTNATRAGISSSGAFLYQWNDQVFVEIWSATIGEDNTGAINQAEYFASASEIRLVDLDGDGMDEIIVDGTRVGYARDAQGLADVEREIARHADRRVYRWGGTAFVLDPARTTPMPKP